ncbi:hypothetical protein SeLEV6574_g04167 [Synchytrium endobioticum]|nr:hypothetical protein SeLEV6574_g04167 [Synchytrium endobioticum]
MIRSEGMESAWEQARRIATPAAVPKTYTDDAVVSYIGSGKTFNGLKEIENLYSMIRNAHISSCVRSNKTVNRVIGSDSVVEESKFDIHHGQLFDWLLPGLKPTNADLTFNFVTIATFQGSKISTQRVYWDQASVLSQANIIQKNVYIRATNSNISLPVVGAEQYKIIMMSVSNEDNRTMADDSEVLAGETIAGEALVPIAVATGSTAREVIDQKKLVQGSTLAQITVRGLEDKTRWSDPWQDGKSRPSSRVIRPPGGGSSITFG